MLNQLPEISAPHPPHILKTFYPMLPWYGDLNEAANFRLLARDVCDWVNRNPVPWEDLTLAVDEVAETCRQNTLIGLFINIYERKAVHDAAQWWCCKSMESIHYVREIEDSGLCPFYVFIYRDGRDVALSFLKAVVGPKHVYHLAKKWEEEQRLSLDFLEQMPSDRYVTVRYEALLANPEEQMKKICHSIGVPFTADVFDYFHSHESINTASSGRMWRNVMNPIMPDNHDKFLRELTREQLVIFERVAGEMLQRLDYKPLFWPGVSGAPFTEEELTRFEAEGLQKRQEVLAKADPKELERRKPQEQLLQIIRERNSVRR
jgi:hypothetical protein